MKLQIDHKDIKSETIVEGDDHKNANILQSSNLCEYSNHSHHASCGQNCYDDDVDIVATDIQREVGEDQHVDELYSFLSVELPLDLSPGERQLEDAIIDAREEPIQHHNSNQPNLIRPKFLQLNQQILILLNACFFPILHDNNNISTHPLIFYSP